MRNAARVVQDKEHGPVGSVQNRPRIRIDLGEQNRERRIQLGTQPRLLGNRTTCEFRNAQVDDACVYKEIPRTGHTWMIAVFHPTASSTRCGM